jgi:uncharacterized GH25 family protein
VRAAVFALAAALVAGPALAHDFWLQPDAFRVTPGATTPIAVMVGDGPERERSRVPSRRVMQFADLGPSGVSTAIAPGPEPVATPEGAGAHVLVLETDQGGRSHQAGPAFEAWLKEAGLTPAIAVRAKADRTGAEGSEGYGRRAKAIVQVGDGPQDAATRPVGLTLEITPTLSPKAVKPGAELPVRVDWEGQPLAGALVKLADLTTNAVVADRTTDAAGGVAFRIPAAGAWRLSVVWTRPLPESAETDFDTVFSSLAFEVGR